MSNWGSTYNVAAAVQLTPLNSKPTFTWFHSDYDQYTRFTKEWVQVTMTQQLEYGRTNMPITTDRPGDIISKIHIVAHITKLNKTVSPLKANTHFHELLPYALFESIDLKMGTINVDRMSGVLMAILNETEVGANHCLGPLIGKSASTADLIRWSNYEQEIHLPLNFFMNRVEKQAFPLMCSRGSPLQFVVNTRPFADLLKNVTSTSGLLATSATGGQIRHSYILIETFTVTQAERAIWLSFPHDMLIDVWDEYRWAIPSGANGISNLDESRIITIQRPSKELLFFVQPHARNSTPGDNDFFNFSAPGASEDNPHRDAIVEVYSAANSQAMNYKYTGQFARVVMPFYHHTRNPRRHVYFLAQAINPENNVQPSGAIVYSVYEGTQLKYKLHKSVQGQTDVWLINRGHQVITLEDQVLHTRYL